MCFQLSKGRHQKTNSWEPQELFFGCFWMLVFLLGCCSLSGRVFFWRTTPFLVGLEGKPKRNTKRDTKREAKREPKRKGNPKRKPTGKPKRKPAMFWVPYFRTRPLQALRWIDVFFASRPGVLECIDEAVAVSPIDLAEKAPSEVLRAPCSWVGWFGGLEVSSRAVSHFSPEEAGEIPKPPSGLSFKVTCLERQQGWLFYHGKVIGTMPSMWVKRTTKRAWRNCAIYFHPTVAQRRAR